jgi:hypothetical protein
MTHLQLLERAGRVEPIDPELLSATADRLDALDDRAPAVVEVMPVSEAASRDAVKRRRRRRVHRRGAVAIGAAAAVVAVVAAVVLPGAPTGVRPAGASELGQLAAVANAQPASGVPQAGQFLYTSSVEAYTSSTLDGPHPYTVQYPETRQIWIGPDGSGRIAETYGQAVFLSSKDKADWVAAGSPDVTVSPSDMTFGPGGLSDGPTDLTKLPTDPQTLGAQISSRHIEGGPPGPGEDFTQIGDLLRETDAPPALRAALFKVAAGLPGVEELGAVRDHEGRVGVGVARVSGGARHELIFNPKDSSLMGEEDVVVDASAQSEPAGTVADWAVYLRSAVVDSDSQSP